MLSFSSFIAENVVQNKRQGLIHLSKMKPAVFLDWLDSVRNDVKGYLDKNTKVVLKCDGMNVKFGKDKNGRVFFEGARTGPQFDSGVFSAYASKKNSGNEEIILRAKHYDDLLELFKKDKYFMSIIPNNVKVDSELFYNPMSRKQDDSSIQFVTVKYDKKKIGSLMTILPYDVLDASTGQVHSNKGKILSDLYSKSNSKVRIINPELSMKNSIDLNGFIDPLKTLLDNKNEVLQILASRKHADRPTKANYIEMIRKVQEDLAKHLLWNPNICGMDKLCNVEQGEGLVFHLGGDYGSVKITSPEFQMAHHGSVK